MILVAAYCRVSTNQEDQNNSFQSQQRYFREYIARQPEWKLFRVYADEGITGTSTRKRREFNRMIHDGFCGSFPAQWGQKYYVLAKPYVSNLVVRWKPTAKEMRDSVPLCPAAYSERGLTKWQYNSSYGAWDPDHKDLFSDCGGYMVPFQWGYAVPARITAPDQPFVKTGQIKGASHKVYMADGYYAVTWITSGTNWDNGYMVSMNRHGIGKGHNILWMDGHVEYRKLLTLPNVGDMSGWNYYIVPTK